jgi:hypothetical protein
MARRRGKGLKVRVRDIDRGYKKLMKRLGVAAKKARRAGTRSTKRGTKALKGIFRDAAKEIKRAQKKKPTPQQMHASIVTIGIHEEDAAGQHGDEGVTVGDVGIYNEFGLGVPERSFIRGWADENEETNKDRLRKIGRAVVTGHISSPSVGLKRFAALAVGEVQSRISDGGVFEPNKPSTVERKGSSKPLIDDGILRSKITSKVERRGSGGGGGGSEGE